MSQLVIKSLQDQLKVYQGKASEASRKVEDIKQSLRYAEDDLKAALTICTEFSIVVSKLEDERNKIYQVDYEAAIKKYKEEHELPYRFSDSYCEDEGCGGLWDGEDRRCHCGNRRLTWTYDEQSKTVYPEPY
jgi:hypothetical protein